MQQRQRLKHLERFRENDRSILVATDVAARGLDIPQVQYVVHYHLPKVPQVFVHRSGRTARATREGLTLALVAPREQKQYDNILKALGIDGDFPGFPIDKSFMNKIVTRISVARKVSDFDMRKSKHNSDKKWVMQTVADADLGLDEDELAAILGKPQGQNATDNDRESQKIKKLRQQLSSLLSQRLLPRGTSKLFVTQSNPQLQDSSDDEEMDMPGESAIAPLLGASGTGWSSEDDSDGDDSSADGEFDAEYQRELASSMAADAAAAGDSTGSESDDDDGGDSESSDDDVVDEVEVMDVSSLLAQVPAHLQGLVSGVPAEGSDNDDTDGEGAAAATEAVGPKHHMSKANGKSRKKKHKSAVAKTNASDAPKRAAGKRKQKQKRKQAAAVQAPSSRPNAKQKLKRGRQGVLVAQDGLAVMKQQARLRKRRRL